MARKKTRRDSHTIAMELLDVRQKKNELNLLDKTLSKELKEAGDFANQNIFMISSSVSIVVADQEKALAWAKENAPHLIEVSTSKAKKFLQANMYGIPDGFETKLVDKLVVAGEKEDE